jgi:predicted PurR-regulated permease PerM
MCLSLFSIPLTQVVIWYGALILQACRSPFAIGCAVPIAYNSIFRMARRTGFPNLIGIFLALLLSYGLASAGLVCLSATQGGQPIGSQPP